MAQLFTDLPDQKSAFLELINVPSKVVLTFHQNPDGDAFGSALALKALLVQLQHDVTVISPTEYADYISWLPGAVAVLDYQVQTNLAEEKIKQANLIFCLDFSSTKRLKKMEEAVLASTAAKVMIDHHQEPEDFANFVFWDVAAAATCQLIFQMIQRLSLEHLINLDVATCLYTGILTDTGSFRFDQTSREVHEIAGYLLEKGINPNAISRKLFDQNSLERMRFLGFALHEKLIHLSAYRVSYMFFSEEELNLYHSKSGDTEGVVNYGLSVAGTVMSVIFIEKEGMIKMSFRSFGDFSVAELARQHFDGGGHKNAAGGRSHESLEKTVNKFLALLPSYQKSLLSQPI